MKFFFIILLCIQIINIGIFAENQESDIRTQSGLAILAGYGAEFSGLGLGMEYYFYLGNNQNISVALNAGVNPFIISDDFPLGRMVFPAISAHWIYGHLIRPYVGIAISRITDFVYFDLPVNDPNKKVIDIDPLVSISLLVGFEVMEEDGFFGTFGVFGEYTPALNHKTDWGVNFGGGYKFF